MNSKQQAIEKAYGENYKKCTPDGNGWVIKKMISSHENNNMGYENFGYKDSELEIDFRVSFLYRWRPKSLQGIETNNYWIKILSDDDLPTEKGVYYICHKDFNLETAEFDVEVQRWYATTEQIRRFPTHYQKVVLPNPPIY